jgi:alkanesulfonate monooxygenase SsuD/methylene tetrahydromethanopterin reductase-like flavin-dependent oxidoreductase (luciferase family)
MHLGVNVPNYGPGTDPGVLREWGRIVEGLGFNLLMVSDHEVVTPDVAVRYPEPSFEPFTMLSWLAGITTRVPIWVGGNSAAAIRRAIKFEAAWHPLRVTLPFLRDAVTSNTLPTLAPRIALRLTGSPVGDAGRLAGTGTLDQILDDLGELRRLGADTVVLDPYHGDPEETHRPEVAWRALTTVATNWRTAS